MEEELYNKLCSFENLFSAWAKVKSKGSAGGIDKVTIEMFEPDLDKNLKELSAQLSAYRYIPEPYHEIKIPKDDNEFRSLALPTIKDKIAQQAVKDLIEPILDKEFLDVSYAYRHDKGSVKAIARISHLLINEKREWITLCDIDRYFDNIDHNLLFSMLAEIIKDEKLLTIIRLWVKMGKVDDKLRWKDNVIGVPQGSIIAPLLSNLYLNPFDKMMVERQFGYARYADDFIILSHTEGEADKALKESKFFLEKRLKLNINPGSCVKKVQDGFEFLGINFSGAGKTVSKEKLAKLKDKIEKAVYLDKEKSLKDTMETIEGISRYYGRIIPQNILEELDGWLVDCLKKHLNAAYQEKLFENKNELKAALSDINFISQKYQLFKKRTLKEISAYCSWNKSAGAEGSKNNHKVKSVDPLKKKKREYQKLEAEGFELLVTTPGIFIGKTKRGITIKDHGVKKEEAPLLNLKNISILSRGVVISSNVIEYCAERGIPINFMGFDGKPYAKLSSPNYASANLGIAQLKAFENGKACYLAKAFVFGKIKNQVNLIKYYNKYRKGRDPDFNALFDEKIKLMNSLAKEAKTISEKDMEILRGKLFSIEGRASACYWELVEKMLNDDVEFGGRIRKGAVDLVNSLLNYGYGIIYSRIWEAVETAGLNPNISYLHKAQEGKPSLTFDLIEEFRQQAVDRPVFALITKGETLEVKDNLLTDETRKRLAEKVLDRINIPENFRGKKMSLYQIMKGQARSAAEFLEGKAKSYRPYICKW